jgi:ribonuclease M5
VLKIREAIVVEGRYDKITLSQVVDAVIVTTEGFGIFKDTEKMAYLRRLAESRGLIVLTDSDGAGFVIRNRIRGSIDGKYVKHAYIPDVEGRERRKKVGSREGTLGVEGMTPDVLRMVLLRAGATEEDGEKGEPITGADMCALGLSGGANAYANRAKLLAHLQLPAKLSSKGLLDAVNGLYSKDEFFSLASDVLQNNGDQAADQ